MQVGICLVCLARTLPPTPPTALTTDCQLRSLLLKVSLSDVACFVPYYLIGQVEWELSREWMAYGHA